ncbi:hypothetical protein WG947_14760 [Pontibacter sp. H259]|uniref:hypothetical protein n=1 Tax=Pontibacter sp. H259 TaxID=3133421 RepID=UPI0030BDAAE3
MNLLFVHILLALFASSAEPNFEQLAANYYFDNILTIKHPELKAAEFATKTDTANYSGILMTCKNWDEETRKAIYSKPIEQPKVLQFPKSDIKVKKIRKRSNRIKVYVLPRKQIGDSYFVEVMAYRRHRSIDYYFLEFNKQGRLIQICEKNEII